MDSLEDEIYNRFYDWLKIFTQEDIYWEGTRGSVPADSFLTIRIFKLDDVSTRSTFKGFGTDADLESSNYTLDLTLTAYGINSFSRLSAISQGFKHEVLRTRLRDLGYGLVRHTPIVDTSVQRNMQGTEKRAQMICKFNLVLSQSTVSDDPLNSDLIDKVEFTPTYNNC